MKHATKKTLAAAVCAVIGLLHVYSALSQPFGRFTDETLQVLLAKNLLAGRFAFPDAGGALLTEPLPGFALLWAVPAKYLIPYWFLFRLGALGLAWCSLYAVWRAGKRFLTPAAAATVLTAFNPVFTEFAPAVLPDVLLSGCCAAIFALLGRERTRWRNAVFYACALLAPMLRPHGAIFCAAAAVAVWMSEGKKRAAYFSAAAFLPLAGWSWRNWNVAQTASAYAGSWAQSAEQASREQFLLAYRLLSELLGRAWLGLGAIDRELSALAAALAAAVVVLGAAKLLRGRTRCAVFGVCLALSGSAVLHLTWPVVTPRYVLPVLPFLWILFFAGAAEAARLFGGYRPRRFVFSGAFLFLIAAVIGDASFFSGRPRGLYESTPNTMDWIRRETEPGSKFESLYATNIGVLGNRWAVYPSEQVDGPESWLARLLSQKIDYVHTAPYEAAGKIRPAMTRAVGEAPRWAGSSAYFKRVYFDPEENSAIYRITHPEPERFLEAWGYYAQSYDAMKAGKPGREIAGLLEKALALEPDFGRARRVLDAVRAEQGK
jgi:hypothetical protein